MDTKKSIYDKALSEMEYKERIVMAEPAVQAAHKEIRNMSIIAHKLEDEEMKESLKVIKIGLNHTLYVQNENIVLSDLNAKLLGINHLYQIKVVSQENAMQKEKQIREF